MKSLNQIIAELEDFATAHWQIHTFGHGDVWEISPQSSGIVYPVLWMVPQTATPTLNEVVDEFTVLCMDLVDSGERNETEVLSDTRQIILDVCAYYRQTHTNSYIIEFGGSIQPFTERDSERVSGHSLTIRIKQPHDYNLCAVPANAVPVPPIPSCADATVQNAASNPTYQASVASGGSLVLPQLKVLDSDGVTPILANYIPNTSGFAVTCTPPTCADATVTVNTTPFGTAPSGGGLNVPVVNGGSNPVGSKQGSDWVIDNNATFINGTQVTDQEAEVDANIFVTLDGAQSGTWNAGMQTWEVTSAPCPPVANVSVAISTSTPAFDQVVTVTATATGITATSYTFYLPSYNGKMLPVTQASNVYLWTVKEVGNWTVRVSATDGSGTGYGTVSGSTVGDIHASAFIARHNTVSGGTMNATYQTYVLGWFLRAKGIYTTHAVDAFTPEIAAGGEAYLYIPVNSTTFSIPAFFINAFNPLEVATPVGFVGADASVNGLTGGVGKHALFNRAPSHFGQNNIGADVYARAFVTSTISMGSAVGADGFSSVSSAIGHVNSRVRHQANDAANLQVAGVDVTGLISLNRNAANFRFGELDGEPHMAYTTDAVYGYNVTSAVPSTLPYMGHACNGSSGAHRHTAASLCFLAVRSVMDDARRRTWAEAAIWLQTQFGRNV